MRLDTYGRLRIFAALLLLLSPLHLASVTVVLGGAWFIASPHLWAQGVGGLFYLGILWWPFLLALLLPFLLATSFGLWNGRSEWIQLAKVFHVACAGIWLLYASVTIGDYPFLLGGPLFLILLGVTYAFLARAIGSLRVRHS